MGELTVDALSPALVAAQAALAAEFGARISFQPPFRGQLTVAVGATEDVLTVLGWLRDHPEFAFAHLADVTAVDLLDRNPRFDVVYHLFSVSSPARVRVKVGVDEGQAVPSATALWAGANYSEREVFDLFGIPFAGHPDLTRILLPDDYEGYPLRRDHELGEIPVDFDLPYRKRFGHA